VALTVLCPVISPAYYVQKGYCKFFMSRLRSQKISFAVLLQNPNNFCSPLFLVSYFLCFIYVLHIFRSLTNGSLIKCLYVLVAHRNQNHRNSTVPQMNMVNSTKQVNKVKPNITRNATDNLISPTYNSR